MYAFNVKYIYQLSIILIKLSLIRFANLSNRVLFSVGIYSVLRATFESGITTDLIH